MFCVMTNFIVIWTRAICMDIPLTETIDECVYHVINLGEQMQARQDNQMNGAVEQDLQHTGGRSKPSGRSIFISNSFYRLLCISVKRRVVLFMLF